ncbi:stage II sporulation protein M [Clostridium polynesiense]|uniref:stage II sporulation protein M n=1 Tax=Clostridium polynesiense TaxID=1325933 RepID=UPI00058C3AC0|nr:stage II sporulation protein M [Clostridium polynesiense]
MGNLLMKNGIAKEIEKNMWALMLIILFFSIGIVLGVYTVKYMNSYDMNNLNDYFSLFLQSLKEKSFDNRELIIEAVKNNFIIILVIWGFGFTILGIPVILITNMIKGYTLGFSFSFIIVSMGYKSMGFALLALMPQNLIYVACIIIISVYSFNLSLEKIKNRFIKTSHYTNSKNVVNYLYCFIVIALIMFMGFFIEGVFTPGILRHIISK